MSDINKGAVGELIGRIGCGFVAAAVKEWCDTDYIFDPTAWDWLDIAATMIGAAVVAVFIVLMHYAKG